MNEKTQESIFFYKRADYLVINSLLWHNMQSIEQGLVKTYKNNHGMIKEAVEQTPEVRFNCDPERANSILRSFQKRTPKILNDAGKVQMLKNAITDILLITKSMKKTKKEMKLFRNVEEQFCLSPLSVGKEVEFLGITSTSTTGQEIEYAKGELRQANFQYVINVPKGMPLLELENDFENEVILPPMKYKVLGYKEKNGKVEFELQPQEVLDMHKLLQSAIKDLRKNGFEIVDSSTFIDIE